MIPSLILGTALGIVFCLLLRDVLLMVWREGYQAGRDAELASWANCAKEADEAVKEIGRKG